MKKPTIYTIAEQCGLSYATVSLVLSGSSRVADATANRVKKVAKEVGYRPNRLARSLKTGSTRTIGVILPSFVYPYHALLAERIYLEATLREYQVQYHLSGNDFAQEERAIRECLSAQTDGIILATVFNKADVERKERNALIDLANNHYPCVLTGMNIPGMVSIGLDHYAASVVAVEHLIKLGYSQIRLIQLGNKHLDGSFSFSPQTQQSKQGFCDALREHGVDDAENKVLSRYVVKSEVVVKNKASEETELNTLKYIEYEQFSSLGVDMFRQACDEAGEDERIGFVFGHEQMAYAVWQYCRGKGLDVPGRIGLVGRGGVQQILPLTTVRWDYEKYAANLVEMLHHQITRPDRSNAEPEIAPMYPWVIERESTALPSRRRRDLTSPVVFDG